MRAPYQEARRIPHGIREQATTAVARGGYVVELLPHDEEPILLPPQPSYTEAAVAAQAWIDTNRPGHTL